MDGVPSIGPIRSKSGSRSSPYHRTSRPPKGDPDAQWSHDLYEDPDRPSLSSRLTSNAAQPRKAESRLAQRALRDATGESKGLSIKGAGSAPSGNVVEVKGLVRGTTAADVEAIFKRCGTIISSEMASAKASENVIVRLTFKQPAHADAAVAKFNGQPADGKILQVNIVGTKAVGLSGRLAGPDFVVDDSVDILMEGGDEGSSKMRSDSILASDPRATVLVVPPGVDPKQYGQHTNSRLDAQKWHRGGRGRGRGRGRRGGGGGGAGMDVD
ncbi:hypothetical protein K503DRAFT_731095 [Rhizopogon vinicolor AM-OR11-026]|uniref:RRM domain-containing protein n=1 Tax=Rhizopogon vinicolor AM-OR11-026 TaxID=1314800 RepID=A0A1B7NFT9_9AGAM|nr:hypothetical protein K503DRAFT_731095 [Rhizopogon vinicolor AM-OR11-026]